MNKQQSINLAEYKYISSLIAQLLEVDIYTEEIITGYIENFGVDKFFNNIEMMDLPSEVIDKLDVIWQGEYKKRGTSVKGREKKEKKGRTLDIGEV